MNMPVIKTVLKYKTFQVFLLQRCIILQISA